MAASLVSSSRFKLIDVPKRVSIREFTTTNGLDFAAGKGFYELMKPELIQDYKEIVAVRRSDGTKVTGTKVRELLGIPSSATKFRLDTGKLSDFKVFVQSTSYNRVLLPGTQFLYEVGDGRADGGADGGSRSDIALTHERPPAPPCGAGMPIEIVLSFDTTGSMSSVLTVVRARLQELIERLHRDIPGIRIAVFAHGDYCDASSSYITKHVDFTTDVRTLCNFVRDVSSTGGGDWEECYELVLKEAREKLSWTPGTQRALVMIGDAVPHEPTDYGKDSVLRKFPRVVWKDEVDALVRATGCRVYSVQCHSNSSATKFWKYMAYHTHGYHLSLSNFSSVLDFIMAICYREQGAEQLQAYRAEVEERTRADGGMNAELHRLFEALGVPTAGGAASAPPTDGTTPATIALSSAPTSKKATTKKPASAASAKSHPASRKRKAADRPTAAATKRARLPGATKKATSPVTPRRGGVAKRGSAAAARAAVAKRAAAASPKTGGSSNAPVKARAAPAGKGKVKSVKAKAKSAKAKATSVKGKMKGVKAKAKVVKAEAKGVKAKAKGAAPKAKPANAGRPARNATSATVATAADRKRKAPIMRQKKKK